MKVKNFNMRAIPIAVPGGVLAISYTVATWVNTALLSSGKAALALLGGVAVYFVIVEAWRNRESTLEYDDVGVRLHSIVGWDVPWSQVDQIRTKDAMGDRFVIVVPNQPADPSGPWGWFGTIFGAPRGALIAPGSRVQRVKKYEKSRQSSGPRVVSTTRQYLRGWLGLLSAVLVIAAFVLIVAGSLDWPGIVSSLGLFPAFGLVWGQAWRRNIAVVDPGGIRRVGIDNWLLRWPQIESAQIIDGTLVVRPRTGKGDPEPALVQDSFQVDDKPSRRRMGAALGQLRETMEADPGLRTVPIAKADQTRIQDAIDHYLGKGGYRAPAAVTSAAEPSAAQWPVWEKSEADDPVDLHEAEIEER